MNGVVRTLYEIYLAEILQFIDTPLFLVTPKLEMLGRGGYLIGAVYMYCGPMP